MSEKDRIMPDFMGRRYRFHYLTAINLLESMGVPLGDIRVRAAGEYENYRGEIRSQDPAPGEEIPAGSVITLVTPTACSRSAGIRAKSSSSTFSIDGV